MNGFKNWLVSPNGRIASLSALVLTGFILVSGAWNISNLTQQIINLAINESKANWDKDQAFRQWAARHGGLYVKPDKRTPPNPYLEHLPDRDVVTTDGTKLTLMNPAYMMSQMTNEFEAIYGIKSKITGQILLNPDNAPDPWELKSLKKFDQGVVEIIEQADIGGAPYIRLMRPTVMTEDCVACHGHLGFKVGDIRGGVSVSIPLSQYFTTTQDSENALLLSHGIIWVFGLVAITALSLWSAKQDRARKKASEAAHQAQVRFAGIVHIAPEAIITVGSKTGIQLFNQSAERIFGHRSIDVLGQPIDILIPPRLRRRHRGLVADFEKSKKPYSLMDSRQDILGFKKDGTEFAAAASVSKSQGHNELLFTVMLRDVSEKRAADAARRQALREAEKANRAKSEFMASMSHELRTPLNSILGFAEMINKEVLGPIGQPKYADYANDIAFSGKHLLELVNQILDIERIEAGKYTLAKEPVNLAMLCDESEKLLKQKADQGEVSLSFDVQKALPEMQVDRRAIFQVLLNIIGNAVKFTPAQGHVAVQAKSDGKTIAIEISDTGIGIPRSKLSTITTPFTRHLQDPMKPQEGVGLGLAIASALVELHGGTMEITSEIDVGTKVTIILPIG